MTTSDDTPAPRRRNRLEMDDAEINEYLLAHRTCRAATVGKDGTPHVSALWYVWDGTSMWLNTLSKSLRFRQLRNNPRLSVLVDDGHEFMELRGVELIGTAEVVGDVPRSSEPNAELTEPETMFARKYAGSDTFTADGRHAWVRLTPERIRSWDFTKIPRPS